MSKEGSDETQLVRKLLMECEIPRDGLPYSEAFEELKKKYETEAKSKLTNHKFWKLVSKTAKKGGISVPGKRKIAPKTRKPSRDQELEILRLFPDGIGSRDDLPYTKRFDGLYKRFSELTGTRFTKHEFWRAILLIAKKSRKPQPLHSSAPLGNLPADTVAFLERLNPWWKAEPGPVTPDLRRWAYDEVLYRFKNRIAPVIAMRGPRQVGKTTIQLQLIERLLHLRQIPSSQILRVQFDEAPALGLLNSPIECIVRWFEKNILKKTLNQAAVDGESIYFFFDEVQNLSQWSEQLKALVDSSSVQILVTGSSALRIRKGHDSLAGRISSIELGPLRLTEIAKLRGFPLLKPFSDLGSVTEWTDPDFWLSLVEFAKTHETELDHSFEAFSQLGGYPVCHKMTEPDKHALAPQIVEDVVERTINHERAKGASEDIVRQVFKLLCRYTGERVSVQELAKQISQRSGSNVTQKEVRSAIEFLEETLLIRHLKPLEIGRKKQNSLPTNCICDHFIRYALLKEEIPLSPKKLKSKNEQITTNAGHIIEGVIGNYFAGLQGVDAFCYPEKKDQPEVDIVLSLGMSRIPIEVKYRRQRVTDKHLKGIRYFCDMPHYEADFGLIVTQQQSGKVEDRIIAVPAKAILLLL